MNRTMLEQLLIVVVGVVLFTACGDDNGADVAVATDTTTTIDEVGEAISDEPTEAAPAETDAPDVAPTIDPEPPAEDTLEVDDLDELDGLGTTPCSDPEVREWYVDVPIDDPDGGLNMRTAPGIAHDIVLVIPRSEGVLTTGACAALGSVDWWKVTTDGSLDGWVSSRFLSDLPVFNPGVGKAIDDPDSVGTSAASLDELAQVIAASYGFDDDVVITMTTDAPAIDAQGGTVTYEMTGLKDDASNGFIVEIDFVFDKDESNDGEIESYTATKVTNYSLCSRGVTSDGLCT